MSLEELQPDYEDLSKQPKTLTKTRRIDDVLYVAGRAPVEDQTNYDVMFITVSVEEDEASTHQKTTFGMRITQAAEYLKGANGIVKDVALRAGVDMDKCYYTAVCKWVLPKMQRARPPKKVMRWGMPVVEDEIRRVQPKIIVCLGKHAFDMVSNMKINFKDAHGCWFWHEEYEAHMYVMHAPYTLVGKPEFYELFRVDFMEIARRKQLLDEGADITGEQVNYQVIRNERDMLEWLAHVEELAKGDNWPGYRTPEGNPLMAVDCEWHGRTHIDGNLRTMQLAWSETEAVVIEFRDEQNWFTYDVETEVVKDDDDGFTLVPLNQVGHVNRNGDSVDPDAAKEAIAKYRQTGKTNAQMAADKVRDRQIEKEKYLKAGKPIAEAFERMGVRYIGHHYGADAPWMNYWLGMEIYERCHLDTEFAQQTCDESSELGLERGIAMKYTNLGRYDQDLVMWKRDNKKLCEDGYGYIPSDILYPYGAKDVITPLRAYPMIKRQLEAQQLWHYYTTIFNPFVTDVFTEFTMLGLPIDMEMLDDLRHLLTFTTGMLNKKLQERIASEAVTKFKSMVATEFGIMALAPLNELIETRNEEALKKEIKKLLHTKNQMKDVPEWNTRILHVVESPAFNIRSPQQMARWLFDFEGLEPIKSTNQKAKGLPSMAWEKVLELPPDRQKLYMPAVDKQTLQILSEQLPTIDELLDLNAVGNLSKAFLKEPDIYIDGDTGEEVREENGIHAWIASDERIHGMVSTTETGRPRSWAPNTLNYPAYVNKRIAISVKKCIDEATEKGELPQHLDKWAGMSADDLPSIRSCICVPDGYVLVESDYATAEMVALAVVSGDADLSRILFEPDPDWVKLDPDSPTNPYGEGAVRVGFSDPKITGIPESARNPDFVMHFWEEDKKLGNVNRGPVTEDMFLRHADGKPVHAKYDIHWSLIERTYGKCREVMKAKVDRAAAKVLNFSSAYGASANSLERKIESDTGVKPDEGTGEKGLEAIAERQPRATQFLEEMARVPKEKGFYRAASGRIRHCLMHAAGSGVGWRTRNSIESALGREMRNFPCQESVGATSARACKWLLHAYRKLGLEARPMTCLYDSVVTLCKLEERHLVARLHEMFMSEFNVWHYDDELAGPRTLQYTIDNEFNWRWSTAPPKDEQETLADRNYHPATARLNFLEDHENLRMLAT